MWVQDVPFVPVLRYSVIFVLMIETKGFKVLFQDGKARLKPRGSSSLGVMIGVREHGIYKLMGKPINHRKNKQNQV